MLEPLLFIVNSFNASWLFLNLALLAPISLKAPSLKPSPFKSFVPNKLPAASSNNIAAPIRSPVAAAGGKYNGLRGCPAPNTGPLPLLPLPPNAI